MMASGWAKLGIWNQSDRSFNGGYLGDNRPDSRIPSCFEMAVLYKIGTAAHV